MTINQVNSSEYSNWQSVWEAFISHMSATLPESQYQNTWSRIRNKQSDSIPHQSERSPQDPGTGADIYCLVARDESGSIVGLAHWLELGRSWKPSPEIYLEDLFVLPEARGHGYGKALLLGVAEEAAQARGGDVPAPDAMHWTTGLENVWANRLYVDVAEIRHKWYTMDLPYHKAADRRVELQDEREK